MQFAVAIALICLFAGCARPAESTTAPSFADLPKASLAQIDGRLRASGLKAEVQVLRDEWGMPHYQNLLERWGCNDFFPLLFSRPAIEVRTAHRLVPAP
jgi:acyl-homoserine lactone acylase PvdQ